MCTTIVSIISNQYQYMAIKGLRHGDIRTLAQRSGYHYQTVRNWMRGKAGALTKLELDRIAEKLIAERKAQLEAA